MPDSRIITFTAKESEDGITLGSLLKYRGVSRSLTAKLKRRENGITLNGVRARTSDIVRTGDAAAICLADLCGRTGEHFLEANNEINVPVLYEDEDVIVFDKPVHMPVHPSCGHRGDTLGNCFAAMYPGTAFRPLNRLDKDTSGLCAIARNPHAANLMQKDMKKVYYAAVCGKILRAGRIDAPIGRAENSIIKREVRPDGKPAVTEYTVVTGNEKYTLLRVTLLTGRTHQIRVHFAHIGYPLAGDDFYGGDTSDIKEQALHCGELEFTSPVSGKKVTVHSTLRKEISELFTK